MKKAAVIYQSKTGTTRKYANEIRVFLESKNIETLLYSIDDFQSGFLKEVEFLFLGCWTKGLMIISQKHDREWMEFASRLDPDPKIKTALFATYKIRTGSMFRKMAGVLNSYSKSYANLSSKDGTLSKNDKAVICDLIND